MFSISINNVAVVDVVDTHYPRSMALLRMANLSIRSSESASRSTTYANAGYGAYISGSSWRIANIAKREGREVA